MNRASTAREALIVEALGDIAQLLDRVESLTSSMDASRLAFAKASSDLADRLKALDTRLAHVTQHAKEKAVEHIVRRTGEAARISIDTQTRAMSEAARLAFTGEIESALARLSSSLRQRTGRIDRPLDLWLTHAATAASSAVLACLVVSAFSCR